MSSDVDKPDDELDSSRHPVEVLADDFASRIRRGESPSIEEYESKHPEWATVIRQVFEPIAVVENLTSKRRRTTQHTHPVVPTQLGDFRIVREIGRGGMGIVYEAIQISLQRRVALKVINFQAADQDKLRVRFRREAEAAARLHHTNIVQVYGSGEDHGVHYYAMQLIQGVPLNEVIEWLQLSGPNKTHNENPQHSDVSFAANQLLTSKTINIAPSDKGTGSSRTERMSASETMPVENGFHSSLSSDATAVVPSSNICSSFTATYYRNVARIVADIANALGYAHRQQILHRDIKPANLILDRNGTIWVTDFGLARRLDTDGATQAGEVLGTIRYMAPEQIAGGGDARMDLYSLGLCLFELVTLSSPFDAPKQRLLDPMRFSELPPPRKLNPNVPADLCTIILKTCAAESNARYQNALELELDLRRFLDDRPILARKASSWEHLRRWAKRNPALAGLSTVTFVMLLTLLAVLAVWNRQQQLSIAEINQLYKDAETNLLERTNALAKERQANLRAESNLQLATQAFDQIIENIASRGSHLFDYEELADESIDFSGVMLSEADVELLESLLSYFKQLGDENEKDLSSETASAHKRVGDIQQRIGKMEDAESSYGTALELYKRLLKADPDMIGAAEAQELNQAKWLKQQIAIYIELIAVQAHQSKIWLAWESYNDCRNLIEAFPSFAQSQDGKFHLAKLLNSIGRMSTQLQARPIRGERPPPPNLRDPLPTPNRIRPMDFAGLPLAARLRREAELNREAINLLTSLVAESPERAAYQSALAQALRDESRLSTLRNNKGDSEKSLLRAIELLDKLIAIHPDNETYQYQLAETLWASCSRPMGRSPNSPTSGTDPNEITKIDVERLEQALQICNNLLQKQPQESAYQALKGTILSRIGQASGVVGRAKAIESLTESIRIYTNLSERFPELPIYRAQRIESLLRLSRIEPNRNKAIGYYDQAIAEANKLGNSRLRNQIGPLIERMRERRQNLENKNP